MRRSSTTLRRSDNETAGQSVGVGPGLDDVTAEGEPVDDGGAGGLLTTIGVEWGLHPVVPAVIAALIGGVIGAWLFMMRTGESNSIADNA